MAVKTITIDVEAYEILSRARRGNESFSTVIKQTLGPMSHTAAERARVATLVDNATILYPHREFAVLYGETAASLLSGECFIM